MNTTGLILSGGGARAAYQVGVLKAVAEIMGGITDNPFKVISGTSAGGINAASLACQSDDFAGAVNHLEKLWGNLTTEDVHNVSFRELAMSTLNLMFSFFRRGMTPGRQLFLLDNTPLRRLLETTIDFDRLPDRIEAGDICALTLAVLDYSSGRTIYFYQGNRQIEAWHRHRRIGRRAEITHDHLMASSAIPGIYPAVRIGNEYFGDGAVRETAPMSPALHMGADKLFVIGSSHNPNDEDATLEPVSHSPSVAQIAGHLFNHSFIDTMEEDVERLERLNDVVARLSEEDRETLGIKPVDVMGVIPGVRIDELAARYIDSLPRSLQTFFRTLGASESGGTSAASYLLFEPSFLRELMEWGYRDGLKKRDEIADFLVNP